MAKWVKRYGGRMGFAACLAGALFAACASSSRAAPISPDRWEPVKFVPLSGTRDEAVVSKLYAGFIHNHPDSSIQVAEVNLNGGHTVSLAVRFVSPATCRGGSSCTTNILWHDGQSWHEIWSRHVARLMLGPVSPPYLFGPRSPTNNADGMRELKGDDGLAWRWIGAGHYYPILSSIATVWPHPKVADTALSSFAKTLHPDYIKTSGDAVLSIPVDFGLMTGYIAIYRSASHCGQIGCPFTVVTGMPGHFQANGEGIIDYIGGTIPDKGWNAFAVQRGGDAFDFYRYEGGRYTLYASTRPTPHLPAP